MALALIISIDRRPIYSTQVKIHQTMIHSDSVELKSCDDSTPSSHALDIVLSYYAEDVRYVAQYIEYLKNVSNLQKLRPRFIVYNKNPSVNDALLRHQLNVNLVQKLPNLGREGATYLYHIIKNYDALSNHTIFSQAGVEGITSEHLTDWFFDRLEHQFNASVGYMPLVTNSMITACRCDEFRLGPLARLPELWAILEQSICPHEGYAMAYRGQFLVSRHRIRARPLRIYQYLFDLISVDEKHWLHRETQSIFFKSTPDNPIFGHVIERAWTIIFRCAQTDLKERCRKRQCACYD